jgi:hypothetical protein
VRKRESLLKFIYEKRRKGGTSILGCSFLSVHKKKKRKIRSATNMTRSFDMTDDLLPQGVRPISGKLHANSEGTPSPPRKHGWKAGKRGTGGPKPGV